MMSSTNVVQHIADTIGLSCPVCGFIHSDGTCLDCDMCGVPHWRIMPCPSWREHPPWYKPPWDDEDEKAMDRWEDEGGNDVYEGESVCENTNSTPAGFVGKTPSKKQAGFRRRMGVPVRDDEALQQMAKEIDPHYGPQLVDPDTFIPYSENIFNEAKPGVDQLFDQVQGNYDKGNQMQNYKSEYADKVPTCIAWAVHHTKEIASRHNGYNTRMERVGEFVTSLRREISARFMGTAGKALVEGICHTEMWRDAGILEREFTLMGHQSIHTFTKEDVIRWERAATKVKIPWHLVIQGELEDMKRDVVALESDVEKLDELTEQADQVMERLAQVLEPLTK